VAFPTSSVIDTFNRANEDPLSDGGKWSIGPDDFGGTNNLRVAGNECFQGLATSSNGYRNDQDYGPNCEVYCTINQLPSTSVVLYARCVNIGSGTTDGYVVYFDLFASPDSLVICRMDNDGLTVLGAGITMGTNFVVGDKVGMECIGSTISAYAYQGGSWSLLGSRTDSTYSAAGKIGVRLSDSGSNARIDDFGGGTVVAAGVSQRFMWMP
jgi:hypothetical protein